MFASDPAPLISAGASGFTERRARTESDPLLRSIGGTPLLPLARIAPPAAAGFELWGKAEFRNPSGSVKDRPAWEIVRRARREGSLGRGQTLLDASSGNTAVAYAWIGARLGIPVEVVVPSNVARDRRARLEELGAAIVLSDPAEGTDGAQAVARARAAADPDRYFFADQYNNPANPAAHYRTTGPELWRQTGGRLTHLVAGVGTGGTISGVGRYLKERSSAVRVVGVEPTGPIHGLEGLKHLPTALRPSTYDERYVDETVRVETEEAVTVTARLAREEGLSVGRSSGAAVVAALRVGAEHPGAYVAAVLPDLGREEDEGSP